MKRKRSSTVEPVWGTLINFTGMKRLNARGIQAANKMLFLAAAVYNLKKWLRYRAPKTAIKAMALVQTKYREGCWPFTNLLLQLILSPVAASKFAVCKICFTGK
ncbi:hypothetical protein BH10BAC2_BH10BAC2_21280 [soil metagenome]